ncbi:MAG: diguanylate cyclase [Thermodesulfobacteriota bacterium]|nr:diguanylate cyclase [Thermodesulfobacteriota bacterium]
MSHFLRVLIAEDDLPSRRLLEKTLISAGYDVVSAENGREAREMIEGSFFSIVITDWMMPEVNGLELCRAVRERDAQGYTFIVILTANNSKDELVAGLEAGADDYITKPFYREELLARLNIIRRYLEQERCLRQANERIRTLSVSDTLTGAYNRYYLNERLPQEIDRARRYGQPLSIIMCDIDHLKKINDLYGHHLGDLVLKEFVDCLRVSIREGTDWLVRYGGDEFLAVMPVTDLEGAYAAAERFRLTATERAFGVEDGRVWITGSFGATCFSPLGRSEHVTSESMIIEADKYLYQAKRAGRNRVKGGHFVRSVHP